MNTIVQIRGRGVRPLINNPNWRGRRILGCSPRWDSFVQVLNSYTVLRQRDDLSNLSILVRETCPECTRAYYDSHHWITSTHLVH